MWQDSLKLNSGNCEVAIRNESVYSPGSADNKFAFDKQFVLNDEEGFSFSNHSVVVSCHEGRTYSCFLIAGGGGTRVHDNSALVDGNNLLVAVGNYVCALPLSILEVEWQTQTDLVTCFGIYHSPRHRRYISHGECDIVGLSYSGEILWQASGEDIFTGAFILHEDFISAVDFNNKSYRIDIETGSCRLTAS